jgi:cytochrome c oxidase assembly protein subunit 15
MKRYAWFSLLTTALTFPLIGLGAIVRLHGAGLACPDWPLCYGEVTPLHEVVTPAPEGVGIALEVGHRYVAGFVGLMVIALLVLAFTTFRRHSSLKPLTAAAFGLLIPQAVLGGLTVIWDLAPVTVSLHLVTGNLFFGSLILLTIESFRLARHEAGEPVEPPDFAPTDRYRWLALAALVLVTLQIWLGGWVSGHGASLACPQFPSCNGSWVFPPTPMRQLQMGHRLVGFTLAGVIATFSVASARTTGLTAGFRALGIALSVMVLAQIGLGWANVAYYIPVPISAAHTAMAATIFGILTYLVGRLWIPRPEGT